MQWWTKGCRFTTNVYNKSCLKPVSMPVSLVLVSMVLVNGYYRYFLWLIYQENLKKFNFSLREVWLDHSDHRPCPGISIIGWKGVDFIDVLYSTSMLIPSSFDFFFSLWRLVLHERANTPSSYPVQRSSSFSFSSLISFSLSEYISIERFPNVFRKEDFRG